MAKYQALNNKQKKSELDAHNARMQQLANSQQVIQRNNLANSSFGQAAQGVWPSYTSPQVSWQGSVLPPPAPTVIRSRVEAIIVDDQGLEDAKKDPKFINLQYVTNSFPNFYFPNFYKGAPLVGAINNGIPIYHGKKNKLIYQK